MKQQIGNTFAPVSYAAHATQTKKCTVIFSSKTCSISYPPLKFVHPVTWLLHHCCPLRYQQIIHNTKHLMCGQKRTRSQIKHIKKLKLINKTSKLKQKIIVDHRKSKNSQTAVIGFKRVDIIFRFLA